MYGLVCAEMMVTGTMGGIAHYSAGTKIAQHQDSLSQETIDFDTSTHDETLSDLFDKCIESWFGRGRITTDATVVHPKNSFVVGAVPLAVPLCVKISVYLDLQVVVHRSLNPRSMSHTVSSIAHQINGATVIALPSPLPSSK